MAKDPAMPFYVNDWLSSPRVSCMSLEQQGAFVRLLCYCWASGSASIPDDEETLARLSGMGEKWSAKGTSNLLRRCFVKHPDLEHNLTNEKLLELWTERQEWREKCAVGGRKSGKTRRKSSNGKDNGNEVKTKTVRTKREVKGNSSSSSSSSTTSSNDEVVNLAATPPGETKTRPRDLLFDAVAEATGLDPSTGSTGGLIAKVRKALAGANPPYTAEDVRRFALDFWVHCPYAAKDNRKRPTPNEIEKNIGLIRAGPAPPQKAPSANGATKGEALDNYAAKLLNGINERQAERVNFSGLPPAEDYG